MMNLIVGHSSNLMTLSLSNKAVWGLPSPLAIMYVFLIVFLF